MKIKPVFALAFVFIILNLWKRVTARPLSASYKEGINTLSLDYLHCSKIRKLQDFKSNPSEWYQVECCFISGHKIDEYCQPIANSEIPETNTLDTQENGLR